MYQYLDEKKWTIQDQVDEMLQQWIIESPSIQLSAGDCKEEGHHTLVLHRLLVAEQAD